jgi:hypothetical protein
VQGTLIPSTKLDVCRLEPVSAEKAAAINIKSGKDFVHLGGEHSGGESSKQQSAVLERNSKLRGTVKADCGGPCSSQFTVPLS